MPAGLAGQLEKESPLPLVEARETASLGSLRLHRLRRRHHHPEVAGSADLLHLCLCPRKPLPRDPEKQPSLWKPASVPTDSPSGKPARSLELLH